MDKRFFKIKMFLLKYNYSLNILLSFIINLNYFNCILNFKNLLFIDFIRLKIFF
jgi:hypothetical protein